MRIAFAQRHMLTPSASEVCTSVHGYALTCYMADFLDPTGYGLLWPKDKLQAI